MFFYFYLLLLLCPIYYQLDIYILKFILNTLTCITNFNILKNGWTLNTTEINSDFYKLQQDYNSLNELFQTIITKNQINENHIDVNQQLTTSLENMSDGFVAINEKWEYTFVNQKLLLFNKDLKN
jgi:hypothetical protein